MAVAGKQSVNNWTHLLALRHEFLISFGSYETAVKIPRRRGCPGDRLTAKRATEGATACTEKSPSCQGWAMMIRFEHRVHCAPPSHRHEPTAVRSKKHTPTMRI